MRVDTYPPSLYVPAANTTATFSGLVELSENLATKVTAPFIAGMLLGLCQLVLEGPEGIKVQLNSPELAWSREIPWKVGVSSPFIVH